MNAKGLGSCCLGGRIDDEEETKGKVEEIEMLSGCEGTGRRVRAYVSGNPPSNASSNKGIVVIATDVFGFNLQNVRLIADSYAAQGYYVVIPDMFEGSEPPADLMAKINNINGTNKTSTFYEKASALGSLLYYSPYFLWVNGKGSKNFDCIKAVVTHLRSIWHPKFIAVQGYCWGGRIAALMAQTDLIDAAIPSHAGGLSFPKDFEALIKPTLFQWAEFDSQIPLTECEKIKPILGKSGGSGIVYPGVHHGFAVRGNTNDENDKKQRLQAFEDAVSFLNAQSACLRDHLVDFRL